MKATGWDVRKTGYAMAVILLAVLGSAAIADGHATRPCRVPHLKGLTVAAARGRAVKAGCRVQFTGAKVTRADVQIVGAQARGRAPTVTLRIEPLCEGVPEHEPQSKPGPTELVTGLFSHFERSHPGVAPPHTTGFWSEPECHIVDAPVAGTVTVTSQAGVVVAIEPLAEGQLATIPLPPGTYAIVGTFAHDHEEGEKPAHSFATPVTIVAGVTVRQDVRPKGPNP